MKIKELVYMLEETNGNHLMCIRKNELLGLLSKLDRNTEYPGEVELFSRFQAFLLKTFFKG